MFILFVIVSVSVSLVTLEFFVNSLDDDNKLSLTQYAPVKVAPTNPIPSPTIQQPNTTNPMTTLQPVNTTQPSLTHYPSTMSFDQTVYAMGSTAKIYLVTQDPFYKQLGKVPVIVTSASDPNGTKIPLVEEQQGVFIGQITLSQNPTSDFPPFENLHVEYFDTIMVTSYIGSDTTAKVADYEEHGDLTIKDVRLMRSTGITSLYNAINALDANTDFISKSSNTKNLLLTEFQKVNQTILDGEYYGTYVGLSNIEQEAHKSFTQEGKAKILPLVHNLITSIKIDTTPEFPIFTPLVLGILMIIGLSYFTNRLN